MSSFIFVRHGQSEANANGTIATAKTTLTQVGIEQARKTAKEVKDLGITMIVCSPMLRAQQTAETIAGELGIDIAHIKIIDELRERGLGEVEGKPKDHESEWYFSDTNEFGVEPSKDLFARMAKCLESIKVLSGSNKILVVGHAVSGFYLQQIAAGKSSLKDFDPISQMSNADFIEVTI